MILFDIGLDEPSILVNQYNTSIILTCSSDGHPKPTYEWFLDGQPLEQVTGRMLYLPIVSNYLNISSMQCSSRNGLALKKSQVKSLQIGGTFFLSYKILVDMSVHNALQRILFFYSILLFYSILKHR